MKRLEKINLGIVLALFVACYVDYYYLLQDSVFSISSIICHTQHLTGKKHLLVLGLLPIYIATVVFGAATLGHYFGKIFQNFLSAMRKRKPLINKNSA